MLHPPAWLRLVEAVIVEEAGRRDLRRHLLAYVAALAFRARGDATIVLTRAEAADLLGVTERTVSNLRRWLDDRGLLLTIEDGTTPRYRGESLADDEVTRGGYRAAVYLLTRLAPEDDDVETDETRCSTTELRQTFTPPLSVRREDQRSHARAREDLADRDEARRRLRRDGSRSRGTVRADGLRLAVEVLRRLRSLDEHEAAPHLDALVDGVGAPFLRSILRSAGLLDLDAEAVVWAIRRAPDGSVHAAADAPAHPVAVLRWRLGLWAPLVAVYGPTAPFGDLRAHLASRAAVRARREAEAAERAAAAPPDASGRLAVRDLLAARRAARDPLPRPHLPKLSG